MIRRNASPEAQEQAWRLPGGYTIPLVAMAICVWLVAQSKGEDWIKVSILLAIGIVLYLVEKWYYSRK